MAPVIGNCPAPLSANTGNEGATDGEGNNNIFNQVVLRNRLTALVVDRSMLCRMLGQFFLNCYGVETVAVGNGKAAVELIASGANFDLIFIDVFLPLGRGLETVREIRARGARSKIVGITFLHEESNQEFEDAGVDGFIEKPITPEILVPLLRNSMGSEDDRILLQNDHQRTST